MGRAHELKSTWKIGVHHCPELDIHFLQDLHVVPFFEFKNTRVSDAEHLNLMLIKGGRIEVGGRRINPCIGVN